MANVTTTTTATSIFSTTTSGLLPTVPAAILRPDWFAPVIAVSGVLAVVGLICLVTWIVMACLACREEDDDARETGRVCRLVVLLVAVALLVLGAAGVGVCVGLNWNLLYPPPVPT